MKNQSIATLSFSLILLIWGASFYKGIETAIDIWLISEIFTHCLFVIPAACYLVFQKRTILCQQSFKPNYWLTLPLIGTLLLYTFGVVGDIRLFMHIATFVSLPLLIWMVIGNQAASKIAFPLYFILFSIPIGEQLIPYLQELTTDIAVPLLELSGVPIYRNGLYLDIPEGRFLVAEACSGISFLIASIVFGHLYAYLSFERRPKQLIFVFISIIVPILANAVRVYGIVLTAHLSDMEYAAGADHIIYGGVFYAIILFLLIVIGERFRDKKITVKAEITKKKNDTTFQYGPLSIILIAMFTLQYFWILSIEHIQKSVVISPPLIQFNTLPYNISKKELVKWKPYFTDADSIQQGNVIIDKNTKVEFFSASYDGYKGELISSINKLYNGSRWTLVQTRPLRLNSSQLVQLTELVSPIGKKRLIIHWYQLGEVSYISKVKIKLKQTFNLLLGEVDRTGLIALSIESDKDNESLLVLFSDVVAHLDSPTQQTAEPK
ncbi:MULTISPECIES: exosortase A [unclassified Colwellia]|uniref:exosortase A n=1 Tax=unclassified Colwellia TaxID=196834 RepID=UPI0015F5E6E7|nr:MULTISPECIES: exosortase A [unclassified Colwellia]MBA6377924.1 exosortase [Colwellia sp. BRX10-7]MBA6387610.1 exosortase [Colwellia sp. BRX10-2]MBA6400932.1 exosortase [Colwellia sp. BRX10-5]MBA6404776.1 exosortase [Colwellia sp. BRX10-1]